MISRGRLATISIVWLGLTSAAGGLYAQRPIIDPEGVVNGGSYARPGTPGSDLAPGSIAVVFGENLAPTTQTAGGYPLPFEMAGVRVTFGDLKAALFEVSPRQLRVQVPAGVLPYGFCCTKNIPVRVTTPQGESEPVDVVVTPTGIGFLTESGAACGPGKVLNLSTEAPFRTPGPEDSAWPGDWIRVYFTGYGLVPFDMPPDGMPAEPTRQGIGGTTWGLQFGREDWPVKVAYRGKAPGLVAVDQLEFQLPEGIPEGCGIPMRLLNSQPIPLSIRRGGGPCIPSVASLGLIEWKRTVWNMGDGTDTVRILMNASEANTFPALPNPGTSTPTELRYGRRGPDCPDMMPKGLDAGTLALQGPGMPPLQTGPPPTLGGEVVYTLPSRIGAGRYSVTATGGASVGAFSSEVAIPEPIRVTTRLAPGDIIDSAKSFVVRWTGGDDNSVVMVRLISWQSGAQRVAVGTALASKGEVTVPALEVYGSHYLADVFSPGSAEVVVTHTPSPAALVTFTADGLSLGGQHRWAYEFHFENLRIERLLTGKP